MEAHKHTHSTPPPYPHGSFVIPSSPKISRGCRDKFAGTHIQQIDSLSLFLCTVESSFGYSSTISLNWATVLVQVYKHGRAVNLLTEVHSTLLQKVAIWTFFFFFFNLVCSGIFWLPLKSHAKRMVQKNLSWSKIGTLAKSKGNKFEGQ